MNTTTPGPALQLAERLTGRQYGSETTAEDIAFAKEHKLIMAFGASDDILRMEGAHSDEIGGPGTALFARPKPNGRFIHIIPQEDHGELVEHGWTPPVPVLSVKADFAPDDHPQNPTWVISSNAPSQSFQIKEGDDLFCIGIVIDVSGELAPLGPDDIGEGDDDTDDD